MSIHDTIAAATWPNGVLLRCANPECDRGEKITSADAAFYLERGWPIHCGQTMHIHSPDPQRGERTA